ncbi:heat shock factor protein 1-like, partial [Haemorhous mexicanus]|uniref:heat shock factor protein 1-like n=1 Tax=Haemorhous mexicanus TaxID=30427 RepID=UPI0028BE7920
FPPIFSPIFPQYFPTIFPIYSPFFPTFPDGFRKVVHLEQGGLVKPERDDTEFQHPFFLRGQERLLENIKRKVTSVSSLKGEEVRVRQDSVARLLADMQAMRGKQDSLDSRLLTMKQ